MELTTEQKLAIMQSKLESLERQKFSLELDVEVYNVIDPDKIPQKTKDSLKNVIAAIKILSDKMKELE